MKKWITLLATIFSLHLFAQQDIKLGEAKFKTGDNSNWKELSCDDSQWGTIKTSVNWEYQGYPDYNGYAWYRFHFKLPSSIKDKSLWKDSLRIALGKIDDNDETYLNGVLIGKTQGWNIFREYHIATNNPAILWDADNVIAVKVFDSGGGGGMYGDNQHINIMDIIDGINVNLQFSATEAAIVIHNSVSKKIEGKLIATVTDPEKNKVLENIIQQVSVNPGKNVSVKTTTNISKRLLITANFEESLTHKTIRISRTTPYILTPAPSAFPKINGATVFGVRPGSPVLYKIAATGEKPLHYAIENLPEGLKVDAATGIITGTIKLPGTYTMKLKAKNSKGMAARTFKIKVGDVLALTPPMGWNSWNCWGLSVSTEKVESSAKALIDKGLIDHGWNFINIDDGWEEPIRDANGNVISNSKFPDMKALSDWLHSNGLKFGIYSSPGPKTCGGYLGSYQHEINDATTYAKWGVDYLKYDWCSYEIIAGKDTTLATYQKPYAFMRDALLKQNRDIVFSLCQYGMKNVWEWGDKVNGNCWRTTGDIEDTWESLKSIGFSQTVQHKYTKPGRWSDPDMLIVGQVGWGENLHPTRLTPDEQYTHISLWSLLSAPLLIGCDISKLDDFTLNLLSNDEVLAVNQDALGKEAKQVLKNGTFQVWVKELEDGSHAVGIFNLSDNYQTIQINWNDIELKKATAKKVRDLWRQKDLGIFKNLFGTKVAPHGVTLIKVVD
ncbi:alpha-galactosidase A precursor [mine drainage metagenome]|uniref:Alpha-galactosidase A n=1 Tax=mine drainage metagenome TaxID=410659 RepID=A0A1J5SNV1_9ZZZZ